MVFLDTHQRPLAACCGTTLRPARSKYQRRDKRKQRSEVQRRGRRHGRAIRLWVVVRDWTAVDVLHGAVVVAAVRVGQRLVVIAQRFKLGLGNSAPEHTLHPETSPLATHHINNGPVA